MQMNFRFAAERTLGKLARWLRLMGFDTVFENEGEGHCFLKRIKPGTILLTRTRQVQETLGASQRFVFIESNDTKNQLRQVVDELALGRRVARIMPGLRRLGAFRPRHPGGVPSTGPPGGR